MSDMVSGIPVGLAVGIGAGLVVGKTQARDSVKKYVEHNAITIQDQTGEPIPIETFLKEAMDTEDQQAKKILRVFLIIGAILFVLGLAVYFVMK